MVVMERAGVAVWCALCVWVLGMSGVQAQTRYHCRDGNGNTFVLSRPCPEGARTTAAVAGPAPAQYSSPRYDSYSPVRSSPETPDHHQYLSARCRALDENIRGAYGRGIKADVVEGMRREYRRDCREEEQDAYSRLSAERRHRDKQRREDEKVCPGRSTGFQGAAGAARPAMRRVSPHSYQQTRQNGFDGWREKRSATV
jgi:hypothetical protein